MYGDKRISYTVISIILALIMFSGCRATIGGKAFTYEEPFSDPDISVALYDPNKAYNGTTLLADNHNRERPAILEINMRVPIWGRTWLTF